MKKEKNSANDSAENDTLEVRTGFYGGLVNPRYTVTAIDIGSGAVLTADMLTRAAEKARTNSIYDPLQTACAGYWELRTKQEQLNKFFSSPVGGLLK